MAKNKMGFIDWIAAALIIIGALNWPLAGIFNYNIVVEVLGAGTIGAKIVYGLIGASGLYWMVRPFTIK